MDKRPLQASAYICDTERQVAVNEAPEVILGTGPDEGSVILQIGSVCISISSVAQLVEQLTGVKDTPKPLTIIS